jgi:penicillin-binding protein 2
MQKKFKIRFIIAISIVVCLCVGLLTRVGALTLTQGDELSSVSATKILRSVSVDGARGDITDVNGIPLAYDQTSYDVQVLRDPSKNTYTDRAYFTDIFMKAIDIIEKNGGKVIDTFNIKRDDADNYSFDFGDISQEASAKREANWRTNMFVSETGDPELIYQDLRDRYRIPEDASYEEARKLLSIWQEIQLSSYRAYEPVTIAENVDQTTVAEIEQRANELNGIEVASSTKRIYPKSDVAAHIIGYTGKMSDQNTINAMLDKGYTQDDTIGIIGIESSMEDYLTGDITGRQGKNTYEVNSLGKVIKEVGSEPATKGDTVMLTLDLQLQMVAEKALKDNIDAVYQQELSDYYEKKAEYDEVLGGREPNLANSGAILVMDVKTGNILAMASYPSYDLNLFSGGISEENFTALKNDPATPLFNKAIASKGIPGSIFKMATGLAGLEEGVITLDTQISDEGYFDKYIQEGSDEHGPACWVEPYFDEHKDLTIETALQKSCNYFFFTVADRLGMGKLADWSQKLGLTEKTGVQLPGEIAGQVGGSKTLYDISKDLSQQKTALPQIVYNSIVRKLKAIGDERNVQYSDDVINNTALKLVQLAANNQLKNGPEVRQVLFEEMDVPTQVSSQKGYDNAISNWIAELVWKGNDTVIAGIGSGITAVTPIEIARYISALVNGGTVYNANLIDRIVDAEGNIVVQQQPSVYNDLNVNQEYLDAIKHGMKDVVSGEDGTASSAFEGWSYKDEIGGKTGTGVVTQGVDLEDNAWFVAFAPFDDPEIAVVTFIPHGAAGGNAIPSVKEVIQYYLDRERGVTDNTVPDPNSVVPALSEATPSPSPSPTPTPSPSPSVSNAANTGDAAATNTETGNQ